MKIKNNSNTISWIRSGIKTSCKSKRELFLLSRNNNNPALTLKWNTHIQILANKLSKVSFMIKSLKGILSPYMIRNIYFTKFQALLRFGILFWGGEEVGS